MADKKKKKQRLIEGSGDELEGVTNPMMEGEEVSELQQLSGGESSVEVIDETAEAESLMKDLKKKHVKRQSELSKVTSPKDDLAYEMRTVKRKSKQKIDETIRREEEELSATEMTEDGTIPMPPEEEEGEVTAVSFAETAEGEEETEEAKVKRLKRKKEKVEEEEVAPFTDEAPESARAEEKPAEPPPEPAAPVPPPAEEPKKTPRGSSMKSKLKDRLKKAKEQAEAEVEQEGRTERRLKREEQSKMTRFDTDIDDAELERKAEERQQQLKVRWKKMGKAKEDRRRAQGAYLPTPEEAYDFFTREFEPEPEEEEEKKEKEDTEEKAETEAKEKEEGEEEEEKKDEEEEEDKKKKDEDKPEDEIPLLDAEEIDEEGYGLVAVRKAEYDDSAERQQKELDMLYYPAVSVPVEEKGKLFEEEKQPRFLEEEGFYVGTRPKISGWNSSKMENRLLKEKNPERWFGEDGRMIVLPCPLRPNPSRPPVPEEPEPYLETQYRKAVLHEYDNRYIDGSLDNAGFYQLDVDINAVAFTHHHLYSREHVLAMKLTQLYEEHILRKKKDMTTYLTEKLKALKNSALHLREHMLSHKSEHSYADRSNFERRLQDYKYEIRRARSLRDKEEQTDRQLLKQIIQTWKELKAQREQQKFTSTPVKLQITKEDVDKGKDQMIWQNEIIDEFEEIKEEAEEIYEKKMAEYNDQLKKYESQQKEKEEARKRIKKRGRKQSKGSKGSMGSRASRLSAEAENNPEEEQKDQDILNEPDLEKPEPPETFNEEEARTKIKEKAKEIRRRPGEPKLYPELTNTQNITPAAQCPRAEQSRRGDLSKCKIFVKVLFNNKEVSRTPSKPLTQDFRISFAQIFNLKIVQWPESIKFQIHEAFGFGSELLVELAGTIPEGSVTSQSIQLENIKFTSNHKVNHSHGGVGSGVPFAYGAKNLEPDTLLTAGDFSCSVAWAVDEQGQPLVPPSSQAVSSNVFDAMKKMDPVAAIGIAGVEDIEQLAKWFEESRMDPNDPANADLVYMLKGKSSDTGQLAAVDYFRLEQLLEEFYFCTDEEIDENKRFKLLQLRDDEVQEFRNYKQVPINQRDIPRDTFTEYERKKREEEKFQEEKDIEKHRAVISKFMQKIREQVIKRFRLLAHQRRLEDVVTEDAVPNIAMIGTSLLKLTERKRPLRVERKTRKKVVPQNIQDVKILVNITRAMYVPIRNQGGRLTSQGTGGGGTRGGDADKAVKNIVGDTLVQPFIEVMFQHNSLRTNVGEGPNPCFNEELQLPLKAPNEDYSSTNLQTVNENIYLNLFDEVLVDLQEDDRDRATTIHQRIEKKWLGSLTIPFSTVYFNGKIEGTFKLEKPPILLGYSLGGGDEETTVSNRDDRTYVSLFITIEPPLQPPEPMKERFATTEDEGLLQYAENWQKMLTDRFASREYKTNVIDVNGKTVFVTRYLKALNPPEELLAETDATKKCELLARFVSMIPSVSDAIVFPGLCDIWSTCDQFLQMMTGDEEEHAVLLANYFMEVGKKTFIVIGKGIPEGPTAYVMTEEGNDRWIWNAGTGEHFTFRDNYCPLQTVGCLISNENIWGNIQQYEKPAQMTFDLSNTSMWQPFFNRSFPNPGLQSYQPEKLYYKTTNERAVMDLQEKIEQLLKNKLMEWRSRLLTRWNRHCTQLMRRLLPVLEQNLGKSPDQQHLTELEQSFSSYKVSGFPINLPYNEISSIVEAVFSTGVHANETSDVEFALAVYVHPYPNDVLSVWVYVASLVRLR